MEASKGERERGSGRPAGKSSFDPDRLAERRYVKEGLSVADLPASRPACIPFPALHSRPRPSSPLSLAPSTMKRSTLVSSCVRRPAELRINICIFAAKGSGTRILAKFK